MATLYVQEQGTQVQKRDNRVVVTKDGQTLQEIPLTKLDQVVLMGRGVQMSTSLLVDLLGRGVPVTLTNQFGSRHYATLAAGPSRFGDLRTQQMLMVQTPDRALALAQPLVAAKLRNQRALLVASHWSSAASAIVQIDAALNSVRQATTIDIVRGYEGAAAAAYWGAWRVALPPAWSFAGRAFHPPPDPINAVLSFGYTLLLNDMLTAIHLTGLDPYLGTFHVVEAGRPSLALDLMEEFRPLVIDRLVLDLVRSNVLQRTHFERPAQRPEAVYLNKTGRTMVLERYESVLNSSVRIASGEHTLLRRVLLLQAQAVARVIRNEQPIYQGYTPL